MRTNGKQFGRLAALETRRQTGAPKFELWVNEGDRLVHHPTGRSMTRKAFYAAFPNVRRITLDVFGVGQQEAAVRRNVTPTGNTVEPGR
jgi:hypothetical protein